MDYADVVQCRGYSGQVPYRLHQCQAFLRVFQSQLFLSLIDVDVTNHPEGVGTVFIGPIHLIESVVSLDEILHGTVVFALAPVCRALSHQNSTLFLVVRVPEQFLCPAGGFNGSVIVAGLFMNISYLSQQPGPCIASVFYFLAYVKFLESRFVVTYQGIKVAQPFPELYFPINCIQSHFQPGKNI